MKNLTQDFFNNMKELLPSTSQEYDKSIKKYGEILETVIIEDVFMPQILKLLSEDKEKETLQAIFDCVEKVVNEDEHLKNIISITMMEILGNDKKNLEVAYKYLGTTSMTLQLEADKQIGRMHL